MTKVDDNLYVEDGDEEDVFEDVSYGASYGESEDDAQGLINSDEEDEG